MSSEKVKKTVASKRKVKASVKIEDGGSAFPQVGGDWGLQERGMTLRDWFAGHALLGIIQGQYSSHDISAAEAYRLADAMLVERARPVELSSSSSRT